MSVKLRTGIMQANVNGTMKDIDMIVGESAAVIKAIEDKGREILDRIPEDIGGGGIELPEGVDTIVTSINVDASANTLTYNTFNPENGVIYAGSYELPTTPPPNPYDPSPILNELGEQSQKIEDLEGKKVDNVIVANDTLYVYKKGVIETWPLVIVQQDDLDHTKLNYAYQTSSNNAIEISNLNGRVEVLEQGGSGFSTEQISILENVFRGIDFVSADARDASIALISSLRNGSPSQPDNPPAGDAVLVSITAVYGGSPVTVGTDIESLRSSIVVTGHYSDGSTKALTGYNLEGQIVEGNNTITVIVDDKTTMITVIGSAGTSTEPEQKLYWLGDDFTSASEYAVLGVIVKASVGDKLYANWDVSKTAGNPKPFVYDRYPDGINGKMTALSTIDIDDDGGYTVTDDRCAAVMLGVNFGKGTSVKTYMDDGRYESRKVQTVPFS